MEAQKRDTITMMASIGQLIGIIIAIGTIILYAGAKSEGLAQVTSQVLELGKIVTDLTKTTVVGSIKTEMLEERLRDLSDRLKTLEQKQK